ncbi:hypothetical protein KEM52_002688, partial [Ascosphaera acerosa]
LTSQAKPTSHPHRQSTSFVLRLLLQAHPRPATADHIAPIPSRSSHPSGLPPDITLETLVSVLLVSAGMVLASEPLKPITWSVWAGEIEREGGHQNPFRAYEDRLGFWDVRTKRKEFADWVRSDGDGDGEKLACTSAAAKSM